MPPNFEKLLFKFKIFRKISSYSIIISMIQLLYSEIKSNFHYVGVEKSVSLEFKAYLKEVIKI